MISSETSANKLFSLVNKFLGDVVINHELLDANRVQYARSDLAQRQRTQQHYCNRKVDVEAVRDKADHVHMSHYLFRTIHHVSPTQNILSQIALKKLRVNG